MLETIFLLTLYALIPLILFLRQFGGKFTSIIFFVLVSFYNLVPFPKDSHNSKSVEGISSQIFSSIETLKGGAQQQHGVANYVDNLDKKKYLKEMMVKHFPDSDSRVSMEKRQGIIYYKTMKKIKEYRRLYPLLKNYQKLLTAEERSSIEYFNGTGIYKTFQDPKTPPNLFDTRASFLKKMEDREMREKFLESYNRENPIK